MTLWDKMGKLGGKVPEFLSTHPSPENRAARLKTLGERVQPLYAAAKSTAAPSFLAAREAINERVVTRPGELTREEYAAREATRAARAAGKRCTKKAPGATSRAGSRGSGRDVLPARARRGQGLRR